MSDSSELSHGTPRREFLHRLVGAGVAVAGTSLITSCATAASAGTTAPSAKGNWDMSWTSKLGRYRTAYDSPEIYSGAALAYAGAAMAGYTQVGVPETDVTPVLILRHAASVMVLNDAMWERLALSDNNKLKDPTTGEPTKRNPFINYAKGDKHSMVGADGGLDALIRRGAVALACNNALTGVAYMLRKKEPALTPETALAELRANVLPGCYVMPNGIFAVSAAQDAGCHYMRVLI
ncbi:MAG: hypothetical protein V4550_17450 [Gemmatimonadota bacterium]